MAKTPVYKLEIGSDEDPINVKPSALRDRSSLAGHIKDPSELPAFIDKHYAKTSTKKVKQHDYNKTLKKNYPDSYDEYRLPDDHTGRGTSEEHLFWHKN